MEISVPAVNTPILSVEAIEADAAYRRSLLDKRCGDQFVVHALAVIYQGRAVPHLIGSQAPPAQCETNACCCGDRVVLSTVDQPISCPGCNLGKPNAAQYHQQQDRRIDEAVLLMSDRRVSGEHADNDREQ